MAIISVNEMKTDRGFTVDQNGIYSYRRSWEVTSDNRLYSNIAAREAVTVNVGDIYEVGSVGDAWYEKDQTAIAVRKTGVCADRDTGRHWIVNIDYGSAEAALIAGSDPLQMRPTVRRYSTKYQEPAFVDAYGRPCTNSAGDPYSPAPNRTVSHRMMQITRPQLLYSDAIALAFEDRVNLDVFYGNDPGTVLCQTIGSEEAFHPAIGPYFMVDYLFELNLRGWNAPLIDQGFYYLDALTDERRQILIDNVPATYPVLLNSFGSVLQASFIKQGIYFTREFELYAGAPFADLGLE